MDIVEKKIMTLCLIQQDGQILLGLKKRGFGEGRWNGFGGKIKSDETITEAAIRELKEEANLEVTALEEVGNLIFHNTGGLIVEMHIFRVDKFMGEPVETEEMLPQWFDADKIPFDTMWEDDRHWLPLFLAGKKFEGEFFFGENDHIIDFHVNEVVPKPKISVEG
ncbi:MAG: 8-oxo-dGTP diphosphatase [Patescibacteria group bacterium]|jgi:8-oxo-dGTP pyrophosphatase MutT (NUDIX family)